MSLDVIKTQVGAFLANTDSVVLALCGSWGVGKTHFWKNSVETAASSESTFALPRYGYVSLFGISSLDSFKRELFASIIRRESIESAGSNIDEAMKTVGESILSIGSGILDKFSKTSSSTIESICFSSIHKTIICIDDLERRSPSLELRDVLGLASLLKEERDCKIVFLLNDGEEGLEDFEKYHEKVVDIKLRFDPTAEECVEIAFENSTGLDFLQECICKLNLTNIRTIKKIKRVVEMAVPLLASFDEDVMKQAMSSIALYGWCHYRADDVEIPTIEHVTRSSYAMLGFDDSDEQPAEEKLWNIVLREYGYTHADELDLELLKGISDGYFVEETLTALASEKHEAITASKSSGSFFDAWKVYHESFADNANEVVDVLFRSFQDNAAHISAVNLNSLVTLFRDLGEDSKADETIESYISTHESKLGVFDLSSMAFAGDITDEKIRKRFKEEHEKMAQEDSLIDVLKKLAEYKSSWNESDEVFLSSCTVSEFLEVFQTEIGPQLSEYIDVCLRFGRSSNSTDRQKAITNKATKALQRLAENNKLNQLRLKRYSISVESNE